MYIQWALSTRPVRSSMDLFTNAHFDVCPRVSVSTVKRATFWYQELSFEITRTLAFGTRSFWKGWSFADGLVRADQWEHLSNWDNGVAIIQGSRFQGTTTFLLFSCKNLVFKRPSFLGDNSDSRRQDWFSLEEHNPRLTGLGLFNDTH